MLEFLGDFKTSPKKALSEIDTNWERYDGLIVCGTHSPKNTEEIIEKIKVARETKRAFLGICMGAQLAAIEYARNVKGVKDATSEEFGQGTFVVTKLSELRVGIRLVTWPNGLETLESHWHNYEIKGMPGDYSSFSKDDGVLEMWGLRAHPFYWNVQFHPEYASSLNNPHFLLKDFLLH